MIGPGIIGGISQHEALLRRWQPQVVGPVIDPSSGGGERLRSWCPDATLVARIYRPDGEIASRIAADPQAAAHWAVYECIEPVLRRGNQEFDYWQCNNEVSHTSVSELERLADFTIGYLSLLAQLGARGAIGCFSTGTPQAPELDGGAAWSAFHPAMRVGREQGAVLLLHGYGAPRIFGPDASWYLRRYEERVVPYLPADLQGYPYLYGEYGCDMGVLGPQHARQGWRTGYKAAAAEYVADLVTAAHRLAAEPGCLGAGLFALCPGSADWADFDIGGRCAELLADMDWPKPQDESLPALDDPPGATDPLWDAVKREFPERATDLRRSLWTAGTYAGRSPALIRRVILHHSVTPTYFSWASVARYHVTPEPKGRGFPGIAYHFGVHQDGWVAYLGDVGTIRWHAGNHNTDSIGICCMGDFRTAEPSGAMLDALRRLLAVLRNTLSPDLDLVLHSEVGQTVCPGPNLAAVFQEHHLGWPQAPQVVWPAVLATLDALRADLGLLATHLGKSQVELGN